MVSTSCAVRSELFNRRQTSFAFVHLSVLLGSIQHASLGQLHCILGTTAPPRRSMLDAIMPKSVGSSAGTRAAQSDEVVDAEHSLVRQLTSSPSLPASSASSASSLLYSSLLAYASRTRVGKALSTSGRVMPSWTSQSAMAGEMGIISVRKVQSENRGYHEPMLQRCCGVGEDGLAGQKESVTLNDSPFRAPCSSSRGDVDIPAMQKFTRSTLCDWGTTNGGLHVSWTCSFTEPRGTGSGCRPDRPSTPSRD